MLILTMLSRVLIAFMQERNAEGPYSAIFAAVPPLSNF